MSLDKAIDDEIFSLYSSDGEPFKRPEDAISTTSSYMCNSENDDVNVEAFKMSKSDKIPEEQLQPVQDFEEESRVLHENRSAISLRSSDSIPGFMDKGNIKKWVNSQALDNLSLTSDGPISISKWEVGDTTDTGMFRLLLTVALIIVLSVLSVRV